MFEIVTVISSVLTIPAILVGIYVAMRWLKTQEYQRMELHMQRDELKNILAESKNSKDEKKDDFSESGPDSGGYIIIDMPEEQKALFHDVLKGFEEYARLKGYRIHFSIDSTLSNKIAFKFTIAESDVTVSTDQVKEDLKDYIHKVQEGDSLDDIPVVISVPEHQALLLAMKNRISFLQHTYSAQQNVIRFYENMLEHLSKTNFGILPRQSFYLQTGGDMGNKKYIATKSPVDIIGTSMFYALYPKKYVITGDHSKESENRCTGRVAPCDHQRDRA
jgi:hypothetical protein